MATDTPLSLVVPDAGRPPLPSRGAHTKKPVKRNPSEAERSVQARGAASVVEILTELGSGARSQAEREERLGNLPVANRADRLQVRLSALESEVGRLQQRGRQLDHHLSKVLAQGSLLTSTIDDFHLRLDALARSHKALRRAAQQNHKPDRYGSKSQ